MEKPPLKLPGVKWVRKVRPDGSVQVLYYHRATGDRLPDDEAGIRRELARRAAARAPEASDSLKAVVERYYGGEGFLNCAPSTQRFYREHLKPLVDDYGDLSIRLVTRAWMIELRDQLIREGHRYKARHRIKVLKMLLTYATEELELLEHSPGDRVRTPRVTPRDAVWAQEQEARMLEKATPDVRRAYMLAAYTAQRPSDILAMRRAALTRTVEQDGSVVWWIALVQAKTKRPIWVPCHPELITEIGKEGPAEELLCRAPRGGMWNRHNFAKRFDRVRFAAGLDDAGLQFRDLRRTAMVRLAEAGATVPEIAAISGHTIDRCQKILDVYIPRSRQMALIGMRRLWRVPEQPPPVPAPELRIVSG